VREPYHQPDFEGCEPICWECWTDKCPLMGKTRRPPSQDQLQELRRRGEAQRVMGAVRGASQIIEAVATAHGLTVAEVCGNSRTTAFCEARHEAMYYLRQTGMQLKQIGFALGGRDHSTIIHGIRRAKERMSA